MIYVMNALLPHRSTILFDGQCNLCSGLILHIKKHDKRNQFHYITLQGANGKELLSKYKLDQIDLDSVILIDQEGITLKSQAVFKIAMRLGGWWKMLRVLNIFSQQFNDCLYDVVARVRYRLFGKRKECKLYEE